MNIRNCRKCKKIFNYVMGPILCPSCRQEQEDKFQEVKKYVQEHTRCGMREVSEACEVSLNQIQQWLREERLILTADSPIGIECEKCGKIIRGGKFCPECAKKMAHSFEAAIDHPVPKPEVHHSKDHGDGARMRFLDPEQER